MERYAAHSSFLVLRVAYGGADIPAPFRSRSEWIASGRADAFKPVSYRATAYMGRGTDPQSGRRKNRAERQAKRPLLYQYMATLKLLKW